MVGLLVGSPIMAESSKYFNPFRVMAFGLGCWTLSTTGSAIAPTCEARSALAARPSLTRASP
jgi:hypothetical protein